MEYSLKNTVKHRRALNIVLIGMPGCGKTTIGKLLSQMSAMPMIDVDEEIVKSSGMAIAQIFSEFGEEHFRSLEIAETSIASKQVGVVIATGGGIVKNPENYAPLASNGRIYFIQRDITELATDGRPLSKDKDVLKDLYMERLPLYLEFADCVTPKGSPQTVAEFILKDFEGSR